MNILTYSDYVKLQTLLIKLRVKTERDIESASEWGNDKLTEFLKEDYSEILNDTNELLNKIDAYL